MQQVSRHSCVCVCVCMCVCVCVCVCVFVCVCQGVYKRRSRIHMIRKKSRPDVSVEVFDFTLPDITHFSHLTLEILLNHTESRPKFYTPSTYIHNQLSTGKRVGFLLHTLLFNIIILSCMLISFTYSGI